MGIEILKHEGEIEFVACETFVCAVHGVGGVEVVAICVFGAGVPAGGDGEDGEVEAEV